MSATLLRPVRGSGLAAGVVQVAVVVVVLAVGAISVPGFASPPSVRAMLVIASFLGIAAIGQTFVVLVGGIDLSVPAVIGAGNVVVAVLSMHGVPAPLTLLVVLGLGAAVGVVNGIVVARWNLPPLVVTLAMGSVVGGVVLLWTGARLTGSAPDWLTRATSPASGTGPLPVPPVVLLWLGLAVVCHAYASRTWTGRQIYLYGVNRRAARLMLVGEQRVTAVAYAVCGALAALTGMLLTGFTGAGLFDVGAPYLFLTIAAVVVGGTSLLGGRGGVSRTVLGTVTLVALTTLLVGKSLSSSAQQAVLGVVIVLITAMYGRDPKVGERL
ncbi:MAG: ribose transport system permease protein [Actinomycetota bacterium]|jgi:ribose transport system permease protein|nr:ribose transport system permease protein [Actinomycetota bacterium]